MIFLDTVKAVWTEIRVAVCIILFALYSYFIWNTASEHAQTAYQKEKISLQQQVIKEQTQRAAIAQSVGEIIDKKLSNLSIKNTYITKEVRSEVDKNPQYHDCHHSPTVMHDIDAAYESASDASGK